MNKGQNQGQWTRARCKFHKIKESEIKAEVCKTFIHRFDSDPRLQPK